VSYGSYVPFDDGGNNFETAAPNNGFLFNYSTISLLPLFLYILAPLFLSSPLSLLILPFSPPSLPMVTYEKDIYVNLTCGPITFPFDSLATWQSNGQDQNSVSFFLTFLYVFTSPLPLPLPLPLSTARVALHPYIIPSLFSASPYMLSSEIFSKNGLSFAHFFALCPSLYTFLLWKLNKN
jgi:hypothetical protein